jgi:hypothetical protein
MIRPAMNAVGEPTTSDVLCANRWKLSFMDSSEHSQPTPNLTLGGSVAKNRPCAGNKRLGSEGAPSLCPPAPRLLRMRAHRRAFQQRFAFVWPKTRPVGGNARAQRAGRASTARFRDSPLVMQLKACLITYCTAILAMATTALIRVDTLVEVNPKNTGPSHHRRDQRQICDEGAEQCHTG